MHEFTCVFHISCRSFVCVLLQLGDVQIWHLSFWLLFSLVFCCTLRVSQSVDEIACKAMAARVTTVRCPDVLQRRFHARLAGWQIGK